MVSVDEFITGKLSRAERGKFKFHRKKSEMNRVRCWMSLIRVIHVIVSLRVHTQAEHCDGVIRLIALLKASREAMQKKHFQAMSTALCEKSHVEKLTMQLCRSSLHKN